MICSIEPAVRNSVADRAFGNSNKFAQRISGRAGFLTGQTRLQLGCYPTAFAFSRLTIS